MKHSPFPPSKIGAQSLSRSWTEECLVHNRFAAKQITISCHVSNGYATQSVGARNPRISEGATRLGVPGLRFKWLLELFARHAEECLCWLGCHLSLLWTL